MIGFHQEGKLNFDFYINFYINTLIKKASQNCHTLAKVCNRMNYNKRRIKINTFYNIQVSFFLILSGFFWQDCN